MVKKLIVILVLIGIIGISLYIYVDSQNLRNEVFESNYNLKVLKKGPIEELKEESVFNGKDRLNVLLIGRDTSGVRRSNGQGGFNTDVMILISADIVSNRILFTSVPRDLWINGNKINALNILYGEDTLVDAFEKITGQVVDGVISIDFDGFIWLVDAFGGVPIEVQRSFSDYTFPVFDDSGITTISFTEGIETMDGMRALTFARSRKGTNGEGSDLMRAKRQHLILQGMANALEQPESIFSLDNIPGFYDLLTQHMETTLTLGDTYYLWDFYKDRNIYSAESFVIGDEYIYHPGMYPESSYTAWVFVPRDGDFSRIHSDIDAKLNGTFVTEVDPPVAGIKSDL
ncbi:MAG: LCP family protein [Patescibacteria group bacterium]